MISADAMTALLIVVPALLLASMLVWVLSAQRREAMAHGPRLEALSMADRLGIGTQFARLKFSPRFDSYLGAVKACNRCQCVGQCQQLLAGDGKIDFDQASRICPSARIFRELRDATA